MKGKKPTCALLAAIPVMLILSMATVSVSVGQAKVFVDPPTYIATLLGEVFTIDINITNVQGLKGFDLRLGYNTTLLGTIDAVVGSFLPRPLGYSLIQVNETEGYVWFSVVSTGAADGNGTLATITFNATYAESASCILDLYDTQLFYSGGGLIDHDVEDGNYQFGILDLTVATDKTTYHPGENVTIHGNLTLDGTPCQGLVALEVDDPTGYYKKVVRTLQIGAAPPPGNITIVDVVPCDLMGNPKNSFQIGTKPYFNLTVRNDGTEPKSVTITINAYDGNMTPLPSVPTIIGSVSPGIETHIAGVREIPTWAYIGTGMVYANALTDLPRDGGVSYCPEKSNTFQITNSTGATALETPIITSLTETTGNYSLAFKLAPDAMAGVYRVYASSLYLHVLATDNTLFGVNAIVVPDDYPTIQEAIDAASPTNNTIIVFPKIVFPETYNEHININKSLTLVGIDPSNTIINGSRTGTVVTVTADKVEISGFTIQNSGSSSYSGITLNNSSDITISENTILSNHNGIYLNNSSDITIRGNNITSNNAYGINIHSSDNNDILDNTLSSNNYGIYLNHSTNNILRGNDMICNKYNFGVFGNSTSDFIHFIDTSNTVEGKPIIYWINQQNKLVPFNAGYVAIVNSANITVRNLNLTKNGQGVLLAFAINSLIERANTLKNEYGIYMIHSHNNTIVGSTVSNNTLGIYQSYSSQNVVCHNNITYNTDQVQVYQSSNTWDDSAGKGNYWSDYNGTDLDVPPDGVGDEYLPWQGVDWYPLMNPWILVHDIAITNVTASDALYSLTEVYPGWKVNVTVTVKNKGDFTDTFNITAYYDENPIGTKNRTVTPQTETVVIITWEDTTGITPGNYYTMKANATIIGLVDINDEVINGQVNFRIIGDVNDDGRVSVADMVEVDIALETQPGEPDHNPYADVNGDGNISIADMVAIDIYL